LLLFKEWCMTFKSLQLHVFSREKGWKMGPVFCVWKSPEKKFFKMFKQIQKYVLVDKKVLWVSPVYPNMSLILDRLDPFNYSLSKRNKKYQDHPATHTWEEWSTAISVQNNCCPRAVFVMKLKKRFSLSVALWWYWYHYRDSNKIKKVINIKLKLVLMKYLPQGLQTTLQYYSISLDLTSLLSAQLASISF